VGWGNTPSYPFSRASILLNAPEQSGVYVLQADTQWIYVGETENILAQLVAHLDGDNLCIAMHPTPTFSYELVPSVIRKWRRDDLVREYRPICNLV
jgi:hypothetical protein